MLINDTATMRSVKAGLQKDAACIVHAAGDEVLKVAAARIVAGVPPTATVTRMGGDEFVVLYPGCGDPLLGMSIGDGIVSALEELFSTSEGEVRRVNVPIRSLGLVDNDPQRDAIDPNEPFHSQIGPAPISIEIQRLSGTVQ